MTQTNVAPPEKIVVVQKGRWLFNLVIVGMLVVIAVELFMGNGMHIAVINDDTRQCTLSVGIVVGDFEGEGYHKYVLNLDDQSGKSENSNDHLLMPCFLK